MNKKDRSNFSSSEEPIDPSREYPLDAPAVDEEDAEDAGDIFDIYYDLAAGDDDSAASDEDGPAAPDEDHPAAPDDDHPDEPDEDDLLPADETLDAENSGSNRLLEFLTPPDLDPAGSLPEPSPAKRAESRFKPEAKYSFSRTLATESGVDGAIVLQYLAYFLL